MLLSHDISFNGFGDIPASERLLASFEYQKPALISSTIVVFPDFVLPVTSRPGYIVSDFHTFIHAIASIWK
jgi:hypothetical protein